MKKTLLIAAIILALIVAAGCGNGKQNAEKQIEDITREETKSNTDTADTTDETPVETPEETEEQNEPEEEQPDKSATETKTQASLVTILVEIKSTVSAEDAMDLDAQAISSLYSIDEGDIAQAAGFVVMAGTFPHEVVMVEAKDSAAADRVEKLLKAKHEAFVQQSKGYDAANYALAQKCKVERYGTHISMFLTPDFETMKSVYVKYIK